MRCRVGILTVALVILATGCSGEEPAAEPTAPPAPTAPTPSPTLDASTCEPELPTSLSADWPTHQAASEDFSFSYPAEWEDLTGQVTYEADEVISEDTLVEAGADPNAQIVADLVRDPSGEVNVTVLQVEGVAVSTAVAYERQATRLEELPAVDEVIGTDISACAGGEPALGLDFLFTERRADTGEEGTFYQRNFFFVHEGTFYATQTLAVEQSAGAILDEVLRTWQWSTDSAETTSGATIAEAATTAEIDSGAEAPDPSTFTSEFAQDVDVIYVVYRLEEGAGGEVQVTWTHEGETVDESSRTLPSDGTWAYEGFEPPPGGHDPGQYEITLTVVGTSDTTVLSFVIKK